MFKIQLIITTDIGPGGSGLWFRNVSDLPNPKWCDPAPYFSWHGILTGERVEIPFGTQTLLAKSLPMDVNGGF